MPDDSPAWAGFLASVLDHCGGTKLFTLIGADFSCQTNTRLASFALTGGTMRTAFRKAVCLSVASVVALSGCATPAAPASPTPTPIYVDPAQYSDFDCDQLNTEAQRVLTRYTELGGKLDESAKTNAALGVLAGVTYIVWPLIILWLPFIPAGMERKKTIEQQTEEFRRLMGERDAILKAAAEKGCPGVAQQQSATCETKSSPAEAGTESPATPDPPK
jgi:hypothetical protein